MKGPYTAFLPARAASSSQPLLRHSDDHELALPPSHPALLQEVRGGGSKNLSLQCVGTMLALAQAPQETSDKPGDASRWQLPGCDRGTRAQRHAAVAAPSTKPPGLGPAEQGLPGTWVMPVPTALPLCPALPLELLLFFFP